MAHPSLLILWLLPNFCDFPSQSVWGKLSPPCNCCPGISSHPGWLLVPGPATDFWDCEQLCFYVPIVTLCCWVLFPLYEMHHNFLIHSSVDGLDGHLNLFIFLSVTNKAVLNIHVQDLGWTTAFMSVGKYLEVRWLHLMVGICLTF